MRAFGKKPLSIADQVTLLESRGLVVVDRPAAEAALLKIGYYRLSAYTLPFEEPGRPRTHHFRAGVSFDDVLRVYLFDRRLRVTTMSAMEVLEIILRACITDTMSAKYGSHWYMDSACFDRHVDHAGVVTVIKDAIFHDPLHRGKRSVAIAHYYATYDAPELPPCWAVAEELSLGKTSRMFASLARPNRKAIADRFRLDEQILESWLHSASYLRNLCAHYARLWNRRFTVCPKIAKKIAPFMPPVNGVTDNQRFYAQALVVRSLLEPWNEHREFVDRIVKLMIAHADLSSQCGFPTGWETFSVWT
jgi:abortive infection bacteriophage resistance protein